MKVTARHKFGTDRIVLYFPTAWQAEHIDVDSLSAISADLGTITAGNITLDSSGFVCTDGKTSYLDTDAGIWFGYTATTSAYQFNIGSSDDYMKWDGQSLLVSGQFTGSLDNSIVGNYTVCTNNSVAQTGNSTYTKVKEIVVGTGGAISTTFQVACDTAGGHQVGGYLYVNGSPAGTERLTTSSTYVTYTEDLSNLSAGDLIQLYLKRVDVGTLAVCRNFRLKVGNPMTPVVTQTSI